MKSGRVRQHRPGRAATRGRALCVHLLIAAPPFKSAAPAITNRPRAALHDWRKIVLPGARMARPLVPAEPARPAGRTGHPNGPHVRRARDGGDQVPVVRRKSADAGRQAPRPIANAAAVQWLAYNRVPRNRCCSPVAADCLATPVAEWALDALPVIYAPVMWLSGRSPALSETWGWWVDTWLGIR